MSLGDLFRGFDNFSNSLVAGVVLGLMIAVGLVLGVVPGIILGALFCFVFPFVVDRELPLPEAMLASRRIAGGEDLLDRCLFFTIALMIGISGIVLFIVGWIFTWSIMWAVVAVAYEDMAKKPAAGGDS